MHLKHEGIKFRRLINPRFCCEYCLYCRFYVNYRSYASCQDTFYLCTDCSLSGGLKVNFMLFNTAMSGVLVVWVSIRFWLSFGIKLLWVLNTRLSKSDPKYELVWLNTERCRGRNENEVLSAVAFVSVGVNLELYYRVYIFVCLGVIVSCFIQIAN